MISITSAIGFLPSRVAAWAMLCGILQSTIKCTWHAPALFRLLSHGPRDDLSRYRSPDKLVRVSSSSSQAGSRWTDFPLE
jgi:hypothetical protein